jgi:predicted MFS family arabinose efflux permease
MRAPEVLRNARFRIYLAAQSISSLGSAMSMLAVTFAIIDLGGSATELGAVLAAGTVPALLFVLLGGVAGDRWERRTILVVSDLVLAATVGTLAVLMLSGQAEIWHFLVGQLVGGTAMAFTGPAAVGLLPTIVEEDHLQQANSLRVSSWNVAEIGGPPIAGFLIAVGSPGWALAADALSYVVSAAFLVKLPKSRGLVEAGASIWGDVRHGWREFTSRKWLWLMVLSFASYQATVLPAIFVLGPILAEREFEGPTTWALVLSARAVGALLAAAVLLRWRPRRPLVASTAMVLMDIPFLLALALGLSVPLVVVTAVLSSAGIMAADTIWESTLQARVPRNVLSRVSSYEWLGSIAINPLGFALIGVVAAGFGVGPVVLTAMCIQIVVRFALLLAPPIRGVRRTQRTPEPAP